MPAGSGKRHGNSHQILYNHIFFNGDKKHRVDYRNSKQVDVLHLDQGGFFLLQNHSPKGAFRKDYSRARNQGKRSRWQGTNPKEALTLKTGPSSRPAPEVKCLLKVCTPGSSSASDWSRAKGHGSHMWLSCICMCGSKLARRYQDVNWWVTL